MPELTSRHLVLEHSVEHSRRVAALKETPNFAIFLAAGLSGPEGASLSYAKKKERYSKQIGVNALIRTLIQPCIPRVVAEIQEQYPLAGMMLELPLPDPSQTTEFRTLIPAGIDVDLLRPFSSSEEDLGPEFDTNTSRSMIAIAEENGFKVEGRVVVNGADGDQAGRSLMRSLQRRNLDPVPIDLKRGNTASLAREIKLADFAFSAVGIPGLIKPDMLPKKRIVLVDAGLRSVGEKLLGDVMTDEVLALERDDVFVTPPIGGVGPRTVVSILDRVISNAESAERLAA